MFLFVQGIVSSHITEARFFYGFYLKAKYGLKMYM